ncbi:hypothetical protein ACIBCM_26705 [Streptomyces sp. NPDC051018]|uniref:hypothetical protein n=1 Tax=Streptomyces sp. NPDC051018 TaxID=3365639 RepID=UPI00379D8839
MSAETPAPRSEGPALELLVHGVGGAGPQEMLGDPRTVRISGDDKAAVFRRADDEHADERHERAERPEPAGADEPARSAPAGSAAPDAPAAPRDRPVPEAYCWSNLTSGNSARALWLLLLPFMVVNLAHWMRPRAAGLARTTRLYGALVRLLALSLTVLLTAAACEVALDLLAWQCAGLVECADGRSWLGFLSATGGGWWSEPGRRLALASLVPAALVGLLWYLSHRTWSAYESQRPPTGEGVDEGHRGPAPDSGPGPDLDHESDPSAEDGTAAGRPALGRPGFWYGRRLVARLRAAHTAAGLLTVSAAVAGAAARHDRSGDQALLTVCGVLLEAVLVLGTAAVVLVVVSRGRGERRFDARADRALVRVLPAGALLVFALSLVYASWSRPLWQSRGTLPGDMTFRVIVLVQGTLVVALAVTALVLHRRARHPRTVLAGLGGPAVAMLACALGGVMTGGVAQRVADWLDGPGTPGMDGDGSIPGPPVLLSWQASVIPVLLVLLLIPAAALGIRIWLAARRLRGTVERDYARTVPPPGRWRPDPARTRQIARARARASVTDGAPRIVGVVAGSALFLGAGAVTGAWISDEVPGKAFGDSGSFAEAAAGTAQSLGSWLVGFGFILFVTWGRRAYRDASARRTIGVLWDVGTFWPRAAHPFAPPCYAERAVPDLTWRMCTWTERTGGRLVISGHSQGSVLAASAVWQLPAATRGRVALLTYGSPLERLYGRWFPAYFGPDALADLRDEVHCWSNLWRHTDPIGGPVLVPAGRGPSPDREVLLDPVAYGRSSRHPLPEPILGHSQYQADPVFATARGELLGLLPGVPRQPGPPNGAARRAQGSSGRSSE